MTRRVWHPSFGLVTPEELENMSSASVGANKADKKRFKTLKPSLPPKPPKKKIELWELHGFNQPIYGRELEDALAFMNSVRNKYR